MARTIALIGNPNCGKTTMFNALTGSNQYVGNWPGVTVEKKEGYLKENKEIKIVDLPGAYAMKSQSKDEKVTSDYIKNNHCSCIVFVVDATNLERNLCFLLQALSYCKKAILAS